ncbi:MAG: hypothetical protein ACOYBV_07670 [Candidatus Avilachnospira sp.]|jgi:hypothetical protein
MTENEAIEVLKNNYPKTCKMVNGRYQGGFDDTECDFGQALTIAISALKEIRQYREIGTMEECRQAMEKQKSIKPLGGVDIAGNEYMICPHCSAIVEDGEWRADYCLDCGQAIDWEDGE